MSEPATPRALTREQQALVAEAIPMVRALAHRLRRRFPEVPLGDFVSMGHEAAVRAASTFDPSRGVPFAGFAYKRVAGAMLRDATEESFGSLHMAVRRAFAADPDAARPPAEITLDEALEDTPDRARARAVAWARRQAAGALLASLAELGSSSTVEDRLGAKQAYARAVAALAEAEAELDPEHRRFVQRYYREGASYETIAAELGVVVRTVTRIHDRVKDRLARALLRRGVAEPPPPSGRPG